MYSKLKVFFISLTITAILVFSAFGTTSPVFADDGTGGSTDTGTPAATDVPVTSDVTGTPDAPVVTPPPADSPTPDAAATTQTDAAATDVPQATESTADVAPPQPMLEQLPDNTTVTVLDANGEAQPLATQASVDAISSAYDPIWCPNGQNPTPGQNGCTSSFSSFNALLTYLKANETSSAYQQAGTIYIQQGQYLGGESSVNFNNYNFNHINNYNLTLQGGWNTINNTTTSTTQFNVPITVGSSSNPWVGSLTFNNIWISGVGNQTGLTAYTQGDLALSNVSVTNSDSGANLNANGNVTIKDSAFNKNKKKGASISANGNIDVSNTTFNENGSSSGNTGKGLEVNSAQNVSLAGVEANKNQVFGANIQATGTVTVKDSFFSGNKSYAYTCKNKVATGGYGLQVITTDAVSLDGVTASDNYFFGAHLAGGDVEVFNSFFNSNGSGQYDDPKGYGLKVESTGLVTLDSVQANENQLFGANIQATGAVLVSKSFFDGNESYTYSCNKTTSYGYGLQVVSLADIIVDRVSASDNVLFGADLNGTNVIVDTGTFSNNGTGSAGSYGLTGKGLKITSAGMVILAKVEANNNQVFGADISATGDVTINDSFFSGQKAYTYDCKGNIKGTKGGGYGLKVVSGAAVTLNAVETTNNYLYGAHLEGQTVNISVGKFSDNGSGAEDKPVGFGLEVISSSQVTLANVEANNNQLFGANIQAGDKVTIANSFFSGQQTYSFNPCKNTFEYFGYGLKVVTTAGSITLDSVEANHNNLWGASLTGQDTNIANSVFNNNVTDSHVFIDDTGLLVESTGTVTLDNVQANENRLIGATIHATGDVLINNSIFSGNKGITCGDQWCHQVTYNGYGLNVTSGGYVELNEVTANDNNLFGAHLEGTSVSIFNSTFNNNGSGDHQKPTGRGLEVISTGQVTLDTVEASHNELFGANITADDIVTVNNSVFSGNMSYTSGTCTNKTYYGYGLKVVTTKSVSLDTVSANDNNLFGASLTGADTTISNSLFNNNGSGDKKSPTGEGLVVVSTGQVTLTSVEASYNELFGANIEADGNVTVLSSIFAGNKYYTSTCKGASAGGYGLKVVSAGDIVLGVETGKTTGVQAFDNGAEGAILVGEAAITVSDSSFQNNGADGLNINAHAGNVTLNNVLATGNGGDGVDVTGVCTNVLNVNGGTFSNNSRYGIQTSNITYNPDGTQTFASNSSGNVFQHSTCVTSTGSHSDQGSHSQMPWWLWWLWNK